MFRELEFDRRTLLSGTVRGVTAIALKVALRQVARSAGTRAKAGAAQGTIEATHARSDSLQADLDPYFLPPGYYEGGTDVPAEPGYFYTGGRILGGVFRRFGQAHYAATGEDVSKNIDTFVDGTLRNGGLSADQGVCQGRANHEVLKWWLVPSTNSLGGQEFSGQDITGLCSIAHFGDSFALVEKGDGRYFLLGEMRNPVFLDYMVRKYLVNGSGFVVDTSPNHETWTYPVDHFEMTRAIVDGMTVVNLWLRAANYLEHGGGYKDFHYRYRIQAWNLDYPGEFISQNVPFKAAYYPDPTRFRGGYQIKGNIYTPKMELSLNRLAGGASYLVCPFDNPNCGF